MDLSKFKDTEQQYTELKKKLNAGAITPDEMKKELKKMMVMDDDGNYWMIGGKSGKWYIYNGTDWKEGEPFKEEDAPADPEPAETMAIAPDDAEYESISVTQPLTPTSTGDSVSPEPPAPAAAETIITPATGPNETPRTTPFTRSDPLLEEQAEQTVSCKLCRSQIPFYSAYCHVCGANQKETASAKVPQKGLTPGELVISSINMPSLIFFLGGLGLLVGVLLGAAFGIFKPLFPFFHEQLPRMLNDTRGGVAGGLVFAAVGGLGGFIAGAAWAAASTAMYNLLAYLFGGVRFHFKQ